jgi:DNA-directed RNA polymerase subunit RPC12/RpoP
MHSQRGEALLLERLPQRPVNDCWPWAGTISKGGYGIVTTTEGQYRAHRLAYETWVGPIPDGETIDHECHSRNPCTLGDACPHRRCCNPAHLRPLSNVENVMVGLSPAAQNARRETCVNGHEFDATRITPAGNVGRKCMTCQRDLEHAWRARQLRKGKVGVCSTCGREMAWQNLSRHSARHRSDSE